VGEQALLLARETLDIGLRGRAIEDDSLRFLSRPLPSEFDERRGVFVTLKEAADGRLRGCVGFPLPLYPLRTGIPRAAIGAATNDPRFPRVAHRELDRLRIEVSILTVPEPIPGRSPKDRLESVRIGQDGLLIEYRGASGLLLPQVAPEQGWGPEEFLAGTCAKAGLPQDAWMDLRAMVSRFQAAVFSEGPGHPLGPVPGRG
jgi:uncharacterized protein